MTKEDWLPYLKKKFDKKAVQHLAKMVVQNNALKDLLDLCFYKEYKIAFRASWTLEYALLCSSKEFISLLPEFVNRYPEQANQSCRRQFTKILMYFSERDRSAFLNDYQLEPLIEATFEWLIDTQTPVAVQANCLNILFNLRDRYDWIEDELKAQIAFLLLDGSTAIQSRGKKLLKQLK